MKFTKINTNEEYPLLNGYRFIFKDEFPLGYGQADKPDNMSAHDYERKIDDVKDSLWDCYGDLCEGEDGELYGVEYAWLGDGLVPFVWARVEKVED